MEPRNAWVPAAAGMTKQWTGSVTSVTPANDLWEYRVGAGTTQTVVMQSSSLRL